MANFKTHSVPAVQRALSLLEVLAKSRNGLSLAQLARMLRTPRSSTHRLLLTLERPGFLVRNAQTHRYMFGLKLFSLASMALPKTQLREEAAPFLHSLMERTRLTVHLAVMEGNQGVIVGKIEPPGLLRIATWVGKFVDLHCTGVGKAILAYLSEEALNNLAREQGLPRYNSGTITSLRKLKVALAVVRDLGYAFENEEAEYGFRCVGAPIFGFTGDVLAAVSVAGSANQIPIAKVPRLARHVMQTAFAISRRLEMRVDRP